MGALRIGECVGRRRLLSFDMGGTSTDVALLDGRVNLTSEGHVGRWPVAVPMVDMHTIGAGGGSIARVDAGGMLAVGPGSAGADPGPACYGRGGRLATVTDANLVLGRLRPAAFLGGNMQLDTVAAEQVIEQLAAQMAVPPQQAAQGVVDLANEHMAQALRVISVQRGIDPAGYTLTAFGGAGGLHVCALAEVLGMRQALVPVHSGVLSALGMLVAPRGRQLSHSVNGLLREQRAAGLQQRFAALAARGRAELIEEGVQEDAIQEACSLDLRYHGQGYTLNVPFHEDLEQVAADFTRAHRQRFGHTLEVAPELVNLRLALSAGGSDFTLQGGAAGAAGAPAEQVEVAGCDGPVPVWRREVMDIDRPYPGPLLVTDAVATTWVAPGWEVLRHSSGCLLLERC